MYHGKKVTLRALSPHDLTHIMDYVNDYETYSTFTDSPPSPKTEEFQAHWLKHSTREDMITFAIGDKTTDQFL